MGRVGSAYDADFPPATQFQLQMLQIVCSDTWAEKDRCCELPALVGGHKALDTVPWPCEITTEGHRVCVDGLSRPLLREIKADFLDEVVRRLKRIRAGHTISTHNSYVSIRSPWSALRRSCSPFAIGPARSSFMKAVEPS